MTNHEIVDELKRLSQEYPKASIEVIVSNDLFAEDYPSSFGTMQRVKLVELWNKDGEYVYIDDEIKEEIMLDLEQEPENENVTEEALDALVEKEYQEKKASGEIKQSILIYVS